jgi:hypothetical protein
MYLKLRLTPRRHIGGFPGAVETSDCLKKKTARSASILGGVDESGCCSLMPVSVVLVGVCWFATEFSGVEIIANFA